MQIDAEEREVVAVARGVQPIGVDLSPRAIKMLTLITGVADGRHWAWNDAAEELDLSDEQEQAVEAEMFAKFTMLEIGVACGHLKQQVLDEMKKS